MNDHDLDAALNCLSVEPGAGFSDGVLANLTELDALRELADRQARSRRAMWPVAGVGGLIAAGLAVLAVLVPPSWLVQTGRSTIVALAAVDCERWAPAALLAVAAAVAVASPTACSRSRRSNTVN